VWVPHYKTDIEAPEHVLRRASLRSLPTQATLGFYDKAAGQGAGAQVFRGVAEVNGIV